MFKIEMKSFRTKVARRIFLLFMACAILPVTALALVSYTHVEKQLYEQSQKRLRQETKSMAVRLYERLLFLRAEMKTMASSLELHFKDFSRKPDEPLPAIISEYFSALALMTDQGLTNLLDRVDKHPLFSSEQMRHIFSGKALLYLDRSAGNAPAMFMGMAVSPKATGRGILIGRVNWAYLWEAAEGRPLLSELYVFDHSGGLLFSSNENIGALEGPRLKNRFTSHAGQFEWDLGESNYLATYSKIFLRPNFFLPEWIVLLAESKEDVLAPMENFKKTFPLFIVLTLGMVFFLSMGLIRKSMGPIEILKEATRKIAGGSFGHRVDIKSGDEFESLGTDFNDMSRKLQEGRELLVRAARMSTMGQMAAGIMHEIKQPLSAIHGHLQLSLIRDKHSAEGEERLKIVLGAVNRLSNILDRFKSFSQMPSEAMNETSLMEIVDQVHKLMEHECRKRNIDLRVESEDALPSISGDSQGLQQVVSNLLINAMHALEEKEEDHRSIIIRTYALESHVCFEMEDNGCGIPEEIKDQVFNPFFTTKSPEKGTGLGMAIVEATLHKHRASIHIESTVGKGTTFKILFPAITKEAS